MQWSIKKPFNIKVLLLSKIHTGHYWFSFIPWQDNELTDELERITNYTGNPISSGE